MNYHRTLNQLSRAQERYDNMLPPDYFMDLDDPEEDETEEEPEEGDE